MRVLVYTLNPCVKHGLVFETVSFPERSDLGHNLLAIGIALVPMNRRMKTIHYGVDLETRRVVHSTPYSAQVLFRPSFKYAAVKPMAYNVRRSRDAC
jgi:hypothetical protein